MTGRTERDPIEQLREADPNPAGSVSTANLARIRARVDREITMEVERSRASPASWRGWAAAGALLGGLVLVLAFVAWPRATAPAVGDATPTPGASPTQAQPSPSGGPQMGVCVESYSLETLANRSVALDGTVTAIDGDDVTFSINRAFRGVAGDTVELTAQGMTGTSISSGDGASFEVGQRYLVAGEDRLAWGCGFSQPFDSAVAQDWARTFAR